MASRGRKLHPANPRPDRSWMCALRRAGLRASIGALMLRFWTYETRGNAFVLLREGAGADGPALARRLCTDRLRGATDGLLLLDLCDGGLGVRMWNPDGTEDFCANGIACAVHLARNLRGSETRRVATPYGSVKVRLLPPRTSCTVEVELRTPVNPMEPAARDRSQGADPCQALSVCLGSQVISGHAVSAGSPHFVIFCDALPDQTRLNSEGPALERHEVFSERMNVTWCAVREGGLETRIWERGVGETLGCGTGAASAAIVAVTLGLLRSPVRVASPGGRCFVSYVAGSPPRMVTRVRPTGSDRIDPDYRGR